MLKAEVPSRLSVDCEGSRLCMASQDDTRLDRLVPAFGWVDSVSLRVQVCHVRKKDIRKFLDGIYVAEKGTVTTAEE